jgi:hypothetical protein
LPKKRCKYWPSCTNTDCPFVHPTTMCPDFPKCPKTAQECLYIHPAITRAPPTSSVPCKFGEACTNLQCTFVHLATSQIKCKYYPNCTNTDCPFLHPPQQEFGALLSETPTVQKVPVPCRDGDACTRENCHFIHPRESTELPKVPCKFGNYCTRADCAYYHPYRNRKLVLNGHKSDRTFATTDVQERIHTTTIDLLDDAMEE